MARFGRRLRRRFEDVEDSMSQLLALIDGGEVDARTVALACVKVMSPEECDMVLSDVNSVESEPVLLDDEVSHDDELDDDMDDLEDDADDDADDDMDSDDIEVEYLESRLRRLERALKR